MAQRDTARGLANKGNRVALGVACGFVAQIFAGLLGAEVAVSMVVWVLVGVITYALVTPRD